MHWIFAHEDQTQIIQMEKKKKPAAFNGYTEEQKKKKNGCSSDSGFQTCPTSAAVHYALYFEERTQRGIQIMHAWPWHCGLYVLFNTLETSQFIAMHPFSVYFSTKMLERCSLFVSITPRLKCTCAPWVFIHTRCSSVGFLFLARAPVRKGT